MVLCPLVRADLDRRGLRGAGRAALAELIEASAAGDVVVVCRLDRLGRSRPELLTLIEDLTARGVSRDHSSGLVTGAVNLAGAQRDRGVQGLGGLGVGGMGQAAAVSPVTSFQRANRRVISVR